MSADEAEQRRLEDAERLAQGVGVRAQPAARRRRRAASCRARFRRSISPSSRLLRRKNTGGSLERQRSPRPIDHAQRVRRSRDSRARAGCARDGQRDHRPRRARRRRTGAPRCAGAARRSCISPGGPARSRRCAPRSGATSSGWPSSSRDRDGGQPLPLRGGGLHPLRALLVPADRMYPLAGLDPPRGARERLPGRPLSPAGAGGRRRRSPSTTCWSRTGVVEQARRAWSRRPAAARRSGSTSSAT